MNNYYNNFTYKFIPYILNIRKYSKVSEVPVPSINRLEAKSGNIDPKIYENDIYSLKNTYFVSCNDLQTSGLSLYKAILSELNKNNHYILTLTLNNNKVSQVSFRFKAFSYDFLYENIYKHILLKEYNIKFIITLAYRSIAVLGRPLHVLHELKSKELKGSYIRGVMNKDEKKIIGNC